MEESGSEGLEELVIKEAKGEFADVDAVCISGTHSSPSSSLGRASSVQRSRDEG